MPSGSRPRLATRRATMATAPRAMSTAAAAQATSAGTSSGGAAGDAGRSSKSSIGVLHSTVPRSTDGTAGGVPGGWYTGPVVARMGSGLARDTVVIAGRCARDRGSRTIEVPHRMQRSSHAQPKDLARTTAAAVAVAVVPSVAAFADGGGADREPRLIGRAVLPVATYAPGPEAGAFFIGMVRPQHVINGIEIRCRRSPSRGSRRSSRATGRTSSWRWPTTASATRPTRGTS